MAEKRPRRFGAEHQIRQAKREKGYDKKFAQALASGALGRATSERQVKDILTKGSK
jgi:hypothetical protein